MSRALHIFRRDLRLDDNTSLLEASKSHDEIFTVFFLDPRQIKKHKYHSQNAFQFMINSLKDLQEQHKSHSGKLHIIEAKPEDALQELIKKFKIESIYINKDYTPFSIKRDKNIAKVCKKHNIPFHQFDDALLHPPGTILKDNNEPYVVFTPFFRKVQDKPVKKPLRFKGKLAIEKIGEENLDKYLDNKNKNIALQGGRKEALQLLKNLKNLKNYKNIRDIPSEKGTTFLSAHNKFGTVSIREVYHTVRNDLGSFHGVISELFWRDFFTHIAFHFPHVFEGPFRKKYAKIKWSTDKKNLSAWKEGKTGFPIVDAGMRELNSTGYMHNRVRMITASFLVKDLQIDWREGEKYFAQKLLDYDPCVNNGNWQWAASTGCDAQPYFRIFNPWSQQKKYDPDCTYIKKWVPELIDLSPHEIHTLKERKTKNYPPPMVNHQEQSVKAKKLFSVFS